MTKRKSYPLSAIRYQRIPRLRFGLCSARHSRLAARHSPLAPAFTLMELTVSVAILAGVMAMVGMIFHTAGKATSQAQSSSSVYRQLLFAAEAIRRDLDKINNVKVLGIASGSILAYENEKDRNSGRTLNSAANSPDWHRADVLMMFTDRQFDPFIYVEPNPATPVTFAATKQVVYSHADVGTLDATGANWVAIKRLEGANATAPSEMNAFEWHLARRVIGFPLPVSAPVAPGQGVGSGNLTSDAFLGAVDTAGNAANAADLHQNDLFTLLAGFLPNPDASQRSNIPSGIFHFKGAAPDFIYSPDITDAKIHYLYQAPPNTSNYWWYLYDANIAERWWRDDGAASWTRDEAPTANIPYPVAGTASPPTTLNPTIFNPVGATLYDPLATNRRTRLPSNSPPAQNERLASYFLPSCSEFKVEFTYDDPREIEVIVDPANTNNRIVDMKGGLDMNADGDPDNDIPVAKPIRWQSVPPGEQWVWSGLSVNPNNRTDPHRWPRALRITMRAYGGSDRLERPITYTLVHAFK